MSFVCEKCHKPQPAHSKPMRVVVARKLQTIVLDRREQGEGLKTKHITQIKREENRCKNCV